MMNIDFNELSIHAVAIVPVIVALVQVGKTMNLPNRYAPILSIGIGIALSFFLAGGLEKNLGHLILSGVLYGLSASGLYSGTKSTAHIIKGEKSDDVHDRSNR